MKKKKFVGIAALLPLALFNFATLPVYAEVTDLQTIDTSAEEVSAECQVIYKSTYDFSEEIPKYPKLEVSASGYEGVYDGKSHGITIDCKTEGAAILYSTDGKTFTANKPEYTDAGIYVTYYKVEKDGYTAAAGFETVRIAEAKIDYVSSDYSGLYDGKAHGIEISVSTNGCKILYSEDGINYSSKKPEYKEHGTYVVYYKILKDNYETVTGSSRVIIKEKDTNIKLSDTSGTVKVDDSIKFTVDTDGKTFNVKISDSTIAKVTVKNGMVTVTGLKEGTATITINCNGKSAVYTVTVVGKDSSNSGSINSSKNISNNSGTISNVQTGDGSNILLYGVMLIASVFGLVKTETERRRKNYEYKKKQVPKLLPVLLSFSMAFGNVLPAYATESTDEAVITSDSQDANYFVAIPKSITLNEDKQAAYSIKVSGNIASNQQVYVSPVDGIEDTEELDFYMKDTIAGSIKPDAVAEINQNKFYWSPEEVSNAYEEADNSIVVSSISSGSWKGTFQMEINLLTDNRHVHNYSETVTKEATCMEAGEKTYTCECGNSYDIVNIG